MEGVVAGVPELADYDVIIDAGADGSDPESAVPFSSRRKAGKEFKQPGNFFALVETSVFGTEPKFAGQGRRGRPRRRRQGRRSPRRCPDADFLLAAATEFAKYAQGARRGREEVGADARGRVHGRGRDDADDVGVLRRVEELALHRRRRGRGEGLRRHLAPARHPRHPRRPRPDLRQHPAERSTRSTPSRREQTKVDLEELHEFAERLLTRRRAARSSPPPTPTRSAPRRSATPRRSPARSRRPPAS